MDIGEALRRAAEGLQMYGQFQYGRQQDEMERKRRDERDQKDDAYRDAQLDLARRGEARQDRESLQEPARRQADALFKSGIMVPPDFEQNAAQAGLPKTGQATPDAGSMAIDALRGAGEQGVDRVYQEGPQALDELYAGKGLSKAMPSGGYAFLEPNVRASLDYATSNREIAEANRKQARELALLRINSPKTDPLADNRMEFITKRAGELMKPQMDPAGFLVLGPGMNEAQAYKKAQAEWELAKGGIPNAGAVGAAPVTLPNGTGGSPNLAQPGLGAFSGDDASFNADVIRKEIAGMDGDSARRMLEMSGYSEEEIQQVLQGDLSHGKPGGVAY